MLRAIKIYLVIVALISCSSHEELPPPDNPFDPGNPDYVSPRVLVVNGPTEGEVIDTTAVTIIWEGNESATDFRYKFDSLNWSVWDEATSQTFDYLDEGNHSFEIQARSVNGDEQSASSLLNFVVDAVAGPAAIIYPYMQYGHLGDTLTYHIIAEEVSDLFAIECDFMINDDYAELIEMTNGDILAEWGGNPLVIQEIENQSIFTSMVSAGGSSTNFTGTSSMLTLRVKVKTTAIIISPVTIIELLGINYLNPSLDEIFVSMQRSGIFDDN